MAEVTRSFDGRIVERAITEDLSLERFHAQITSSHAGGDCPGTGFPQPKLSGPAGRPHPGSLLSVHYIFDKRHFFPLLSYN